MEGFFRRLQTVVDVDDDDAIVYDVMDEETRSLPNDVRELKRRIVQALGRAKLASDKYDELHGESCKIESELAALRLRYKTSREQWLLVHEFDQKTIEALLEDRLSTHRVLDGVNSHSLVNRDETLVSSLREQNATLRELIRKYGEERDRYQLELKSPPTVTEEAPVSDLTPSDRAELEARVAELESALANQSEAMNSISVQLRSDHETHVESHRQEIERLEHELATCRSAASLNQEALTTEKDVTPLKCATGRRTPWSPLPPSPKDESDAAHLTENAASGLCRAQLDAARAENAALEEAMHALYKDLQQLRERNVELEEHLLRAEEHVAVLRHEAAAAQETCRAERERCVGLQEAAARAGEQRQRLSRELAAANDALRKSRLQTNHTGVVLDIPPTPSVGNANLLETPQTMERALNGGAASGPQLMRSAGRKLQDFGRAAMGTLPLGEQRTMRWAAVMAGMGRRRRILLGAAALLVLLTVFSLQLVGGGSDVELVSLRLQEELRECRAKLRGTPSTH